MSCSGTSDCDCGCCAGTSVQTPQQITNTPGLSAISYRVGTWSSFKESMLARLSSADYPALQPLKTRADDDFTIPFLDSAAMVLDILTFYQERLVNESYLRTAAQLRSLTELSRLIGYRPAPGVSASTYAAFSLRAAPAQAPNPSNPAINIPLGTQVQSVPAQGQTPQTFETSSDIPAKADWSALPVQAAEPWPVSGSSLYLSGTSTQLQLGDSLLFLSADRENWPQSQSQVASGPPVQWSVVVINRIQIDAIRNLTLVLWDQPLLNVQPNIQPTAFVQADWTGVTQPPKVFAFRQKASLFGHNAPDANLFVNLNLGTQTTSFTSLPFLILNGLWINFQIASSSQIDLDAIYSKIAVG